MNQLGSTHLDKSADNPGAESETDSGNVHAEAKRSCAKEVSGALEANHEELDIQLSEEDDPEPPVLIEAGKDVERGLVGSDDFSALFLISFFIVDLGHRLWNRVKYAAIDHVENVHHDEALEHEGLVDAAISIPACRIPLQTHFSVE